ncbi:unnamed protein product [Prunus armeniaca]
MRGANFISTSMVGCGWKCPNLKHRWPETIGRSFTIPNYSDVVCVRSGWIEYKGRRESFVGGDTSLGGRMMKKLAVKVATLCTLMREKGRGHEEEMEAEREMVGASWAS